jgi:hypothetical protein
MMFRDNKPTNQELISKVVALGTTIRRHRSEGNLHSVTPPTIWGYMAFLRMAKALPHLQVKQVAMATLLGNAGMEDQKIVSGIMNEVFGLADAQNEDSALGSNLF